jgi:hypothetical protein
MYRGDTDTLANCFCLALLTSGGQALWWELYCWLRACFLAYYRRSDRDRDMSSDEVFVRRVPRVRIFGGY